MRSPPRALPVPHPIDRVWVLAFFAAALLLFTIDLGDSPLRDWDEGTIAQVARNISRAESWEGWVFPTLSGAPYWNKPPLLHWFIALGYQFYGVSEWTTRLPPALLSATSVPLMYRVGLEAFGLRLPAIFSTLIYLTLLPVVRHGRLAMLDGSVLCFFLLAIALAANGRRNIFYSFGVGCSLGLIALTKSILALLLGAIILVFLAIDTPRLLKSGYLWLGLLVGSIPVSLWYGLQLWHYGSVFLETGVVDQSFSRIWQSVENRSGPPWYYCLEVVKLSWPWLLFILPGFRLAWRDRHLSWGKLVLVWSGIYLTAISVMGTKLPWYVLPLYPALALAGGAQLAEVWSYCDRGTPLLHSTLKRIWKWGFWGLSGLAWGGLSYLAFSNGVSSTVIGLTGLCFALTLTFTSLLFQQANAQFISVLGWGCYLSLILFMSSGQWIWELNEGFPVKPVARLLAAYTPTGQSILSNYPHGRPSLDFYSDRRLIPSTWEQIEQAWSQYPQPYLLLDPSGLETFESLHRDRVEPLEMAAGWTLVTKSRDP